MHLMISEKASKAEILQHYGSMSLEKVIKLNPPSMAVLAKQLTPEKCMQLTAVLVADLSQFFNGDLDKEDCQEVAAEVQFTLLKNLSLEDVYVALQKIKRSKISYKLTANEVVRQLNAYLDERCNLISQLNYSSHLAIGQREKSLREIEQEKRAKTKSLLEIYHGK